MACINEKDKPMMPEKVVDQWNVLEGVRTVVDQDVQVTDAIIPFYRYMRIVTGVFTETLLFQPTRNAI